MGSSLNEFKQDLLDLLLRVHWRQWTALGVPSDAEPERQWIIDLESLIISTFALGLHDRRLLSSVIEWMIKNGEWINLSRYKRVGKVFMTSDTDNGLVSLSPAIFAHMPPAMSRYAQPVKPGDLREAARSARENNDYDEFFRAFQSQDESGEPDIQRPPLLQLLLRGVFGIDARAEVLIYFLCHESGNSNSIARELFYDQKAVYRIIERWKASGIVETVPGGKIGNCSLKKEEAWTRALGFSGNTDYFNWVRFYFLCATVLGGLSSERIAGDQHLACSFFKGLYEDVRAVAVPLNVEIGHPRFFPGEEFSPVFISAMMRVIELLGGV
jgi:hypothetical protein